jgi:ABC-type uncharacterized transport system ATPase subunit
MREPATGLAIEASGLVKTFGPTRALDGIDLAVPVGTVYGLLGPNGAGKTTAVRVLATLLRPDDGEARVFGHDVVRQADAVRGKVSLTGQYASVDEDLTGTENLTLLGRLLGHRRPAAGATRRRGRRPSAGPRRRSIPSGCWAAAGSGRRPPPGGRRTRTGSGGRGLAVVGP